MSTKPESYSLLWPANYPPHPTSHLNPRAVNDLSLDNTLAAFDRNRPIQDNLRQIIFNLTTDPAVIRYRQAILADIDASPALFDAFSQVLPLINAIGAYRQSHDRRKLSLQEVAWRASELEYLLDSVTILQNAFTTVGPHHLKSAGLQGLYQLINQVAQSEPFQRLKKELPEILPKLRSNVSVTIGVNLDRELRPVEATLVSINKQKFDTAPLLDRLLGRRDKEFHGIAPIHKAPIDIYGTSGSDGEYSRHGRNNPLLAPLFRDLANVLEKISKPISQALQHYVNLNGHFLSNLRRDISFYLAAIQLTHRLREQNLPLCQPEIVDSDLPVCEIDQSYNLNLAHHFMTTHPGAQIANRVIQNDIRLNQDGAIQILTGPNQGGKTTYTQMVGINQILAQAGLYVPGTAARITPVDNIYTHYPVEEELELATGRFGDEAQRLAEIFAAATPRSLILLNESLASTSPGESIYLAQDIVRILRRMGARAVFNTHLHELAASVDQLNRDTAGMSRIISMIASAQKTADHSGAIQRNYKIIPGPPLGHSYAKEIAQRYGISYEQLTDTLQNRGILGETDQD